MTAELEAAVAGSRTEGTWTVRDLGRLVDRLADRPELWQHIVLHQDGARWYTRLHLDDDVEVWLLTWAQDTFTEMHDHGGSVGAYRVVEGVLTEDWAAPGRIRRRTFAAGRTMAFGAEHIHDVTNQRPEPAVSIHAYSPPLRTMTYYLPDGGAVRPVRTVDVSDRVPA
jgi:predicted metal-dependent enzyme (double-stranded beta helix superfamily)